jgi:hypothetical protein
VSRAPSMPRIVAKVPKSKREHFRVAIRDFNGEEKIEVRVIERTPDGREKDTPRHIVVPMTSVDDMVDALRRAEEGQ